MEEDEEEFDDAMDRDVDSEEEKSYVVHRSDSPSLSAEVNSNSNDEGGKDFLKDNLSVIDPILTLVIGQFVLAVCLKRRAFQFR